MKKVLMIFAGLLFFSLATVNTADAQAQVYKDNAIWYGYNPCNGDYMDLPGEVHVVSHWRMDEAGGYHMTYNVSFKGEGVSYFGFEYKVNYSNNRTQNMKIGQTYTEEFMANAIGKGDAPNVKFRGKFHYTVNANGELTAWFDSFEVICK